MNQNQAIENAMKNTGFLGNSGFSQIPVGASQQQALTRNQQALTRNQQGVNTGQLPVNTDQLAVNTSHDTVQILSVQGQQAKKDLEILVATGKTKDLTGKQLTFNDLDYMFEKDLLKYHRIYQNAIAARVNDTFSTMAVKYYAKLACWLLPIEDEDKLYNELKNDYIIMSEIEKWSGLLALKMGGLMAVATTSLITMGNCDIIAPVVKPSVVQTSAVQAHVVQPPVVQPSVVQPPVVQPPVVQPSVVQEVIIPQINEYNRE